MTLDAFCDNDTPWVAYSVDANGLADTATITFSEDPPGDEEPFVYVVPVGEGQVLWPGAEIDAAGNPIDWPGWDQDEDGNWFLNPDNPFAWARGRVTVTVEVNPTETATLTYPPAEPTCNAAPPDNPDTTTTTEPAVTTAPPEGELPRTGSDSADLALLGGLLILVGAVGVIVDRLVR